MIHWFDSKWLKLLDLPGHISLALSVACWLTLFLAETDVLRLGIIPAWMRAGIGVLGILSTCLFVATIGDFMIKNRIQIKRRQTHEQMVIARLDTLSNSEREVLSYLIQANQQSFSAELAGDRVATLVQKGLVIRGSGVHSYIDWPFMIPNFVWVELQRRKDEFNTANLNHRPPWLHYRRSRI